VPALHPAPDPAAARPRRAAVHLVRATALALAVIALAGSGASGDPPTRREVAYVSHTMGTYAQIILVTADSAASAPTARAAQRELDRLDSLMTNWTTTSEVARINRVAGTSSTVVDSEVAVVIARSLLLWRQTEGAFDITVEPLVRLWGFLGGPKRVPADSEVRAAFRHVGAQRVEFDSLTRTIHFTDPDVRIDLGGIAKGYAVDAAARVLQREGVTDALVNLSGNMFAIGTPPGADRWRIGVRDPRDRMPYFARIELQPGEGISTSAKYEQFVAQDGRTYGHIMDPRTGRPADGLIAVTVVSKSGFECDSWDTPLFVLGAAGARRVAKRYDVFGALLVSPGTGGVDTVWVESSLADRFTLEPAARELFREVVF